MSEETFKAGYEAGLEAAHRAFMGHNHQALYLGKELTRECKKCGRDLADKIHFRPGENTVTRMRELYGATP